MTHQTTAERIAATINEGVTGECDGAITGQMSTAQIIAAEIDTLTRERDEARAEVERLRQGGV